MKNFDPSTKGVAGRHLASLRDDVLGLHQLPRPEIGTSGGPEITLKFPDVTAYAKYSMRDRWILSLRQPGGTYWGGIHRKRFPTRAAVVAQISEAVGRHHRRAAAGRRSATVAGCRDQHPALAPADAQPGERLSGRPSGRGAQPPPVDGHLCLAGAFEAREPMKIRQQLEEWNRQCERICRDFQAADDPSWKPAGPRSGTPNFQLIYSSVETFETPGGVMFLGTNPGGDHTRADVHDPWLPFRCSGWSSYLDDDWGSGQPGDATMQRAVQSIACVIAGGDESGIDLLRRSPAGNIIPFRSKKPGDLPRRLRKDGRDFGRRLIQLARPSMLILLSSNKDMWNPLMDWMGHPPEPDWEHYLGANLTFREAQSAAGWPGVAFALPAVNNRNGPRNSEVIDLLRQRLARNELLLQVG